MCFCVDGKQSELCELLLNVSVEFFSDPHVLYESENNWKRCRVSSGDVRRSAADGKQIVSSDTRGSDWKQHGYSVKVQHPDETHLYSCFINSLCSPDRFNNFRSEVWLFLFEVLSQLQEIIRTSALVFYPDVLTEHQCGRQIKSRFSLSASLPPALCCFIVLILKLSIHQLDVIPRMHCWASCWWLFVWCLMLWCRKRWRGVQWPNSCSALKLCQQVEVSGSQSEPDSPPNICIVSTNREELWEPKNFSSSVSVFPRVSAMRDESKL